MTTTKLPIHKWALPLIVVMCSLVGLTGSAYAQGSVCYDAALGTLPQAQGWTFTDENGGPAPSVSGGLLHAISLGSQRWTRVDTSLDFSQHVVIEARLRVNSSNYVPNVGTGTREGYYFAIYDRNFTTVDNIGLASDGFNLNTTQTPNHPLTPFPIADGSFHTYRFDIVGGVGKFEIDGEPVASGVLAREIPNGGSYSVLFGGTAGASRSDTDLAYFCYESNAGTFRLLSDNFDFWKATQQNGSVGLSSDQSHSGLQSLKMASTGGGQRNIFYTHTFPKATKGTLSTWFYDTAPGVQTLYAGLYAFNSAVPGDSFTLNVADWNGSKYIWSGPGQGEAATSVTRTLGWHQFSLRVTMTGYDALIDQVVVGSVAGDFAFDTVRLLLSGPPWNPDAQFYFDDFTFVEATGTPVPLLPVRQPNDGRGRGVTTPLRVVSPAAGR